MHSSRRTATCAPHSSTSPNQALAPVLSSLPAPSLARANPLPRPISPSRLPTPVRASCWWMVTCAKASFTSFSELLPNPVSAKCSQPASPVPKPFDPQKWPISGSCRAARLPTDQVNYSSTPRRENFSRRLPSNTTMFSLTPRQSWPPTTSPVWPPNWTGQSSSCVLIIRPPGLPGGQGSHRSSELFINASTGKFLQEIAIQYDYVLVDTAPVMAADDVTSLAPKLDGTIFVVRADYTSARLARAALDLLYQRQVKVIGQIG